LSILTQVKGALITFTKVRGIEGAFIEEGFGWQKLSVFGIRHGQRGSYVLTRSYLKNSRATISAWHDAKN
jgi:hypothetical protein